MKLIFYVLAYGFVFSMIAFGVGFFMGSEKMLKMVQENDQRDLEENLSLTLEEVARIRTGDQDGVIERMEWRLDDGIISLPQGKSWEELPEYIQDKLRVLKAYRIKFPSERNDSLLKNALKRIPDTNLPSYGCSEALTKLLAEESVSITVEQEE